MVIILLHQEKPDLEVTSRCLDILEHCARKENNPNIKQRLKACQILVKINESRVSGERLRKKERIKVEQVLESLIHEPLTNHEVLFHSTIALVKLYFDELKYSNDPDPFSCLQDTLDRLAELARHQHTILTKVQSF